MSILSWFKSKEPEDYEQILSAIALDIQKRQSRLSDIKIRERRTTLMLTIYTFAAWIAYVGLWYAGFLSKIPRLAVVPVFVGPIIIQFSRRIVQTWYTRIENAEEKTLKDLLAKQRNKVEEIKKKTNYYSTKNLLDRYDSPTRPGRPGPGPSPGSGPKPVNGIGGHNRQQSSGQNQPPITPQRNVPTQLNGVPKGQPSPISGSKAPATPVTPPRKQWYDKLADALLGEDDPNITPAASRYALICRKCFAHNGLVKPEYWEDAQYICPKCGHFNASMRAIKLGQAESFSPPSKIWALPKQNLSPDSSHKPGRKSAPPHQGGALLSPDDLANSGIRRTSLPTQPPSPLSDNEENKNKLAKDQTKSSDEDSAEEQATSVAS